MIMVSPEFKLFFTFDLSDFHKSGSIVSLAVSKNADVSIALVCNKSFMNSFGICLYLLY